MILVQMSESFQVSYEGVSRPVIVFPTLSLPALTI